MQRELSAKLTEGLFDTTVQILAYPTKIVENFIVRYPDYRQIITLKKICPFIVIAHTGLIIMLRAVKFNHQLGFGTIKIYDIMSQYFLTLEFDGVLL